jgi:hypothetical protein
LIKVPPKIKINGQTYVDNVLKPLFEKFLPEKYPNEMSKVVLHHDKASSHTCKLVQEYLKNLMMELGINYLKNNDIPTKAPDIALLDFFGFGYLKQMLFKTKVKTLSGLWKKCKELWSGIPQDMINRAFQAWKRRCRMVYNVHGNHIENTKKIHSRSLKS